MINIAIIDDEEFWSNKIEAEIRKNWNKKDIQTDIYRNAEEFVNAGKEYQLVLMDVEMPGMDGFEAVELYRRKYPDVLVAMVTSHMELAPKGYKVDAFRYLCKANLAEDMEEALQHVEAWLIQKKEICFRVVNQEPLKIACEDIIYVETEKRNLKIYTTKGDYTSGEKMSDMETMLKEYGFYSVHRSILVNFAWVKELHKSELLMRNGDKLVISGRRKKEIELALYQWRFERANQ